MGARLKAADVRRGAGSKGVSVSGADTAGTLCGCSSFGPQCVSVSRVGHGDYGVPWKRSFSIRMRPGPDGKSKSVDQNPEDPVERLGMMGAPEGGIMRDGPLSVRKKSKAARDSSGRENSQVRFPGRT